MNSKRVFEFLQPCIGLKKMGMHEADQILQNLQELGPFLRPYLISCHEEKLNIQQKKLKVGFEVGDKMVKFTQKSYTIFRWFYLFLPEKKSTTISHAAR